MSSVAIFGGGQGIPDHPENFSSIIMRPGLTILCLIEVVR